MFSIFDFEQVTVNRYLKRKRTLTKKIERSTINAGFKYTLSHEFPKCKIYNDPGNSMFNFSKNDFFLIVPQSNHVLNKEHKAFLRNLFCRYFFEAYLIVIMQNIVKELSALDYMLLIMNCIPRFAIYAALLQSSSKIIRMINTNSYLSISTNFSQHHLYFVRPHLSKNSGDTHRKASTI